MSNSLNHTIRRTCLDIRQNLSLDFQHSMSHKICTRIRGLAQYRHAKRIALYHAIKGEVDLSAIWRAAPLHGKYCYFPTICANQTLAFLPATPSSCFRTNDFGILEPESEAHHAILPDSIDLILTPLVAFDKYGTRIGMGKGYYDRTLAHHRPRLLIGVAYEFQQQPYIEPQPWDVRLDAVVTEHSIYWSPS
jgi:5-formyltetrahydrofolate cyclo-ligase